MRIAATILFVLALAYAGTLVVAEDAPSSEPVEGTVSELTLGDYWWGAKINKDDLRGKVVLWETWGS